MDSAPVCGENYNSTAEQDTCYHGYVLGFKKGCKDINMGTDDPSPEYTTCRGMFPKG